MTGSFKKNLALDNKGMTLPELLVALFILILAVTGILLSFLRALELQEVSQAFSTGTKAALSRMDKIRATDYDLIKAAYNGASGAFDVAGLNAKGSCYVDDSDPNLLLVAISISWKQKNGRIYGGDKNLNGQLDAGETAHTVYTALPNSPLIFVSRIFER